MLVRSRFLTLKKTICSKGLVVHRMCRSVVDRGPILHGPRKMIVSVCRLFVRFPRLQHQKSNYVSVFFFLLRSRKDESAHVLCFCFLAVQTIRSQAVKLSEKSSFSFCFQADSVYVCFLNNHCSNESQQMQCWGRASPAQRQCSAVKQKIESTEAGDVGLFV